MALRPLGHDLGWRLGRVAVQRQMQAGEKRFGDRLEVACVDSQRDGSGLSGQPRVLPQQRGLADAAWPIDVQEIKGRLSRRQRSLEQGQLGHAAYETALACALQAISQS